MCSQVAFSAELGQCFVLGSLADLALTGPQAAYTVISHDRIRHHIRVLAVALRIEALPCESASWQALPWLCLASLSCWRCRIAHLLKVRSCHQMLSVLSVADQPVQLHQRRTERLGLGSCAQPIARQSAFTCKLWRALAVADRVELFSRLFARAQMLAELSNMLKRIAMHRTPAMFVLGKQEQSHHDHESAQAATSGFGQ